MLVSCPHCKTKLKVDDRLAGRRGVCPSCKATLTIPKRAPGPAGTAGGPPPIRPGTNAAAGGPAPAKPPSPPVRAGNVEKAAPRSNPGSRGPASHAGSRPAGHVPPVARIQAGNRVCCPWCNKVFAIAGGVQEAPAARPEVPPETASPAAQSPGPGPKRVGPPPLPPVKPKPPARPAVPAVGEAPAGAPGPGGTDGLSIARQTGGGFSVAFKGGLNARQVGALKTYGRKYSPAAFGLAILCFVLPFTHISCQGERVASLSGLQLVVGTEISGAELQGFGDMRDASREKVNPEPLAILALVIAIVGVAVGFRKDKKGRIASIAAGAAGAVVLLLLKLKIDNEVATEGEGLLEVAYGSGYYLAFLFLIGAAALHVWLFLETKRPSQGGQIGAPF